MSSSIHNLLKTQESLQPIFQNESNSGNVKGIPEENKQAIPSLGKLKDDSAEDLCFPDFQSSNGFLANQVSPSFNHEAGSTTGRPSSSTTLLKTSPAMHNIVIPDLSLTELKTVTEMSHISDKDRQADMSEDSRSSTASANNGVPTRRESIVSSASSHQVPTSDSQWKVDAKSTSARQRPLRSSSALCAGAKRTSSPSRKGRGSYVCTKPKNKRNQRR